MAIYSVHLPPLSDRRERLSKAVFIRDGFSKSAFAFGALWLIARRLWISALLFMIALIGLWAGAIAAGLPLYAPALVSLLLGFLLGLEGSSLEAWRLRRRGWSEAGIVSARDEEEAERRFYDGRIEPPAPKRQEAAPAPARETPGVIGLFPEPGSQR
jgi:hypothetical protein